VDGKSCRRETNKRSETLGAVYVPRESDRLRVSQVLLMVESLVRVELIHVKNFRGLKTVSSRSNRI
jgi:hypothetical protein